MLKSKRPNQIYKYIVLISVLKEEFKAILFEKNEYGVSDTFVTLFHESVLNSGSKMNREKDEIRAKSKVRGFTVSSY